MDNVMHILYQPCTGHGYTAPTNTAAPIGVLEWNAAAYFAHRPPLSLSILSRTNAQLTFDSQIGWGYHLQTSTDLYSWTTLATLSGTGNPLQNIQTNAVNGAQRYWRLEIREGGF
jgi:hypothetical protein